MSHLSTECVIAKPQWVELHGASIRYEVAGEGPQTLVLIHEAGGTLESWDAVWGTLTQHFRVLRYDQRGFGLSEKIGGALSLETVLKDLEALLDALGWTAPNHLLGGALGAGFALAFAARYASRVARVVACNPATGVSAKGKIYLEERAKKVLQEGMRSMVEISLDNAYPPLLRTDLNRYEQYKGRWLSNDPQSFAAMNRMVAAMDLSADFSRIQAPTLVIAGLHDRLRAPEEIESVARLIPNVCFEVLNTGHFMAVQTPQLVLDWALPFLSKK